jgi:hypothetical protein
VRDGYMSRGRHAPRGRVARALAAGGMMLATGAGFGMAARERRRRLDAEHPLPPPPAPKIPVTTSAPPLAPPVPPVAPPLASAAATAPATETVAPVVAPMAPDEGPARTRTGKALRAMRLILFIFLAVLILGLGLGLADWKYRIFNIFRAKDALTLYTYFSAAHDLAPGSTVTLNDINVGLVREVELVKDDTGLPRVRVKIGIQEKGESFVLAGTKAKLEPQVAGQPEIELVPPDEVPKDPKAMLARTGDTLEGVETKTLGETLSDFANKSAADIQPHIPRIAASIDRTLREVAEASGTLPGIASEAEATVSGVKTGVRNAQKRAPLRWIMGPAGSEASEFEAVPREPAQ